MIGLASHIMGYDYPEEYNNWNAVDPKVLLDTAPVKSVTKQSYTNATTRLASSADEIILACDFDREGENIGFEARYIAEKVSKAPVKRARFLSLSTGEINRAFEETIEPDEKMAMAVEARQILDLKMGAAFTRYIALPVRERAIRNFKSKDYWKIEALFSTHDSDFTGLHRRGHRQILKKRSHCRMYGRYTTS